MKFYREILIELAKRAGEEILKYYQKDFVTKYKSDNSPVTIADIAANNIIVTELNKTGLKIISEESSQIKYEDRKDVSEYWLVDPIDGTKQFVKGEDEFTVNIALIRNNKPVEGVVFAPALKKLYYGNIKEGAFLYDFTGEEVSMKSLPLIKTEGLSMIVSKSHLNEKTASLVSNIKSKIPDVNVCSVGSSLKFCRIAEGSIDIYPRIGAISEWDIGAGHAVLSSAGGCVKDINTGNEIIYNSTDLRTPDFIAYLDRDKYDMIKKIII
ncbi:MAG: 3'(2'),5'-bisphosphate nucleotidase CysQ [Bacteroidales bacterium]|nr:3'(2'),5'-bisphosphate nucleotidase CysQ [Bacteroidales bacterium]